MADENITLTISRAGRWLCEERHELSTPYDLSLIPRAHVKKPMCWSVHICNPTIHVERKEGREKNAKSMLACWPEPCGAESGIRSNPALAGRKARVSSQELFRPLSHACAMACASPQ